MVEANKRGAAARQPAHRTEKTSGSCMATLEKAICIAAAAHAGQLDKEGGSYFTHPLRVMAAVEGDDAKIVAILHDVVEDTTVTIDDLRREGFSEELLAGVACVTHHRDEPYTDYVVRCKNLPLARKVKLADLADNSRPDRCLLRADRIDRDLARIHRYMLSYKFLIDRLSESDYRSLMAVYGELD
jgi:(p)ppGpp synthase/HD superfamily hydrolase